MRRRTILLSLTLIVLPALSCRHDDGGSATGSETYTAEEVSERFNAETDDQLAVDASQSTTKVLTLRLSEPPLDSRLAISRYGDFAIFVVDPAEPNVSRLLSQQLGQTNGVKPDRRGIIWRRTPTGWAALRRYGRNVVLGWYEAREKGSTDERWARLVSILAGLRD